MGYSFRLTARVLLYAPSHRQDNTYHGLCYTSRGALAGTRNSSMGPPHEGSIRRPTAPWANALPLSYIPLPATLKPTMPAPKKRRLFSSPPPTTQGIAASYVLEHFNTVPFSLDRIQKGHIIFLWITNNHNVGLVDNKLCTILRRSDSHSLNYSVAKVVKSLFERYKKLTDPKQFERFENECAERFM